LFHTAIIATCPFVISSIYSIVRVQILLYPLDPNFLSDIATWLVQSKRSGYDYELLTVEKKSCASEHVKVDHPVNDEPPFQAVRISIG